MRFPLDVLPAAARALRHEGQIQRAQQPFAKTGAKTRSTNVLGLASSAKARSRSISPSSLEILR
ncbi:MAG: hypothetical protein WDN00_15360 [Limisphaerales bacterium]